MRFETFQKTIVYLAMGLLWTGCASNPPASRPAKDSQPQVSAGVDMRDLTTAAAAAVQSLLESGVFDRAPHHPAVLGIGRFANATSHMFDASLLTGQISSLLVKTGKVVVSDLEQPATGSSSRSDFTLSGSVHEIGANRVESYGVTRQQTTYVFQFSLADSNNLIVWAENKEISRITTSPNQSF